LSEDVVDLIDSVLGKNNPCLTSKVHLPGGDFLLNKEDDLMNELRKKYDYLDLGYLERLFNLYGTRAELVLSKVSSISDLGINFGKDLYQSEVDYLMKEEFALFPEDITERRTKLYLFLNDNNLKELGKYMEKNR